MGEEGNTIRDKVSVGLALLVGVSPLIYVVVWGFWTVVRRMDPENEPTRRIEWLAPQLRDIVAGTKSAQSLIDWLKQPTRSDYLLIQDRQSGENYVVDWYGSPYFFRVTDRSGHTLVDRRGNRIEGNLSLERIEQLQRLAGMQPANLVLISLGADLALNGPNDMVQDDVQRVLPIDREAADARPQGTANPMGTR